MEIKNELNEQELENVAGGKTYVNKPYCHGYHFIRNGRYQMYHVVSGDYLSGIANAFSLSVEQLMYRNRMRFDDAYNAVLTDPDRLPAEVDIIIRKV